MAFFDTPKEYGANANQSTQSGVAQQLQDDGHGQTDDIRMRPVDSLDKSTAQAHRFFPRSWVRKAAGSIKL